jgi:predicted hotdog family 3-hydroxylacyl-ACP dehydratase
MLLVDEVIHIEDDHAVAAVQVSDRWPLADRETVSPLMIIEAVAQTAGLGNGLNLIKEQGKGADKTGWIVGIKKARFFAYELPLGARIVVESKNRFKSASATVWLATREFRSIKLTTPRDFDKF